MNSRAYIAFLLLLSIPFMIISCGPNESPSDTVENEEVTGSKDSLLPVASLDNQSISFDASFDDGVIDGFTIIDGEWQLTEGQDGNLVAEIDNREGASNPAFQFGGTEWTDYSLNYRFKYLADSAAESEIYFEFHNSERGPYQVAMGLGKGAYVILGHISNTGSWNTLAEKSADLPTETWHDLRLDVAANRISLVIDGVTIFTVTDDSSSEGFIAIGVSAGTHAQFDDFRVEALTEDEVKILVESEIQLGESASQDSTSDEAPAEEAASQDSVSEEAFAEETEPGEAAPIAIDSEPAAPIPAHLRLIEEDFEDGTPVKSLTLSENWTVLEDERGDLVYQIDTRESNTGWDTTVHVVGNILSDYGLQFDFRFMEFATNETEMIIGFLHGEQGYHGAALRDGGIRFEGAGSSQFIELPFLDGEWHTFRFEARGENVAVYVDGSKWIDVDDAITQLTVWEMGVQGNGLIQMDDLMLFDLPSAAAEIIELTSDQISEQAAQITIDGNADDWAALPPIGIDPQGDQNKGLFDIGEVRAVVNDGELLLNIQPYETLPLDKIDILMFFLEEGRSYSFSVSPDKSGFHNLGAQLDGVESAFGEIIEIRIPFWGFQQVNPKVVQIDAYQNWQEGDFVLHDLLDTTEVLPLPYFSGDPLSKIDPSITLLPESRQIETPREFTEIVIDGKVDDWEDYPILTIDTAGDNILSSPDFGEVRAFVNAEYFYVMIKLNRPGKYFVYELTVTTPDTGYWYNFDPRDNVFVHREGGVMHGLSRRVPQAEGEAIEFKIPLFLMEDPNIEMFHVLSRVENDMPSGDEVTVFAVPFIDEVEPVEE